MSKERKTGGVPSKQAIYTKIASNSNKIIEVLLESLDSRNPSVRLGAAKILINKIVPDLKAVEWSTDEKKPIAIQIIKQDISKEDAEKLSRTG